MFTRQLAHLRARRRARELSSPKRAGAWSRRRARELQNTFLRRHWRMLLVVFLAATALTPLSLMLPDKARWFFLGAWITGTIAFLSHFVIVASGSARLVMADQGEQWTQQELQALRGDGWKVIHRVLFRRYEDIDTIAVGPPGVVVVETKWSSDDWTSPRQARWIKAAVVQVTSNVALVERQIRQRIGAVKMWPVVVLWPSDPDIATRQIDGVTVLRGLELRDWIKSLPPSALAAEKIDGAWEFLEQHVAKRDANDLKLDGPAPRSPLRYLADIVQYPIGALIGLLIMSLVIQQLGWPLLLLPGTTIAAGAAWALRFQSVHRLAVGILVATLGVVSALGVLIIISVVAQ